MDEGRKIRTTGILMAFLKIGLIGFGGGAALIPVIEREFVEKRKALSQREYLNHVVVANITPGPLAVKLGATCGYQLGGLLGAIAGAFGAMLPGVLLSIAILALIGTLGQGMMVWISRLSVGISAFIVFLVMNYIIRTLKSGNPMRNILLCAAAFFVTGGKAVRQMVSLIAPESWFSSGAPLFQISTIQLILITFCMIFVATATKKRWLIILGLVASVAAAFCLGVKGTQLGLNTIGALICLVMAAGSIIAMIRRRDRQEKQRITIAKSALITCACMLLIPIVMILLLLPGVAWQDWLRLVQLNGDVSLSTVITFGGGTAYISVADGIFVGKQMVSQDIFYTLLVPITNAMPGIIMVKLAALCGYHFAATVPNASAWLTAITAASVIVGIASTIAILAIQLYDAVQRSAFIKNVSAFILPVICGLLLSTCCTLLYESMKITGKAGIATIPAMAVFAVWTGLLYFSSKRLKVPDIILLVLSAGVGAGVLCIL